MKRDLIIDIIVAATMFLMLYAATAKLMEYNVFKAQLGRSPMTMYFAPYLAFLVPGIEILTALLLAIPKTRLIGLYTSFLLMYAFTAYISIMLLFSPSLPCSCGGVLAHLEWGEHLVFNIGFTLLGAMGILLQVKKLNAEQITDAKIELA
jgi:hypothetical protein